MLRRFAISVFALSLVASAPAYAQSHNYNQGEPEPLSRDPDSELVSPPAAAPLGSIPAASPTDTLVRLQNMETQLRNMMGTVEQVQFRNQQLEQALQRKAADDQVRFQILEKKIADQDAALKAAPPVPAAAATPAAPANPIAANAAADTAAAVAAAGGTPSAPAPKTETVTDAPPPPAPAEPKTLGTIPKDSAAKIPPVGDKVGGDKDAQALYDQGFKNISDAKYDAAEKDFKSFLKAYPKHKLTENTKYWLAESYYARSRFPESAVAFAETYQEFPNGGKAPDNLLKLAMSLGAMDKKPDACLTLVELKKRFPNASAMIRTRAEQEKKTLACT